MVDKYYFKHTHNGIDSPLLANAPQSPLTAEDDTALTTGGGAILQTSDAAVIDNLRTRLGELEEKLQNLGFIE